MHDKNVTDLIGFFFFNRQWSHPIQFYSENDPTFEGIYSKNNLLTSVCCSRAIMHDKNVIDLMGFFSFAILYYRQWSHSIHSTRKMIHLLRE